MTDLERRIRRLALLVPALAIAAAVFGFWPNGLEVVERSFKNDHVIRQTSSTAGGYSVLLWAICHWVAASAVRASPKRGSGWTWFAVSFFLMIGGAVGWLIERFTLADQVPRWPATLSAMCAGTVLVLTLLALPFILIVSDNELPQVPTARVE